MSPAQDVVALVVCYNSAETVEALLDSVPAAMGSLSFSVVVVDNGSDDGTVEILKSRGDCTVVPSTNTGYAGGINAGVRAARPSDYLMVLNPDVVLSPESVARLVGAAQLFEDAAVIAPRTVTPGGSLDFTLRREPTLLRAAGLNWTRAPFLSEYVNRSRDYDAPCIVDWAVGASLLLDRDVFERLGGWDQSYFMYSEETDYCLRVRDHGFTVRYEPSACVSHIGGGSGRSDWTHTLQVVNRVRLFARRHGRIASYAYYLLTVASESTWVVRGHKQSQASLRALVRPSTRPQELDASTGLLPR